MRKTLTLLLAGVISAIGANLPLASLRAQIGSAAQKPQINLPTPLSKADAIPLVSPRLGAPDLAFGAFQRGYYVTAMKEAMKRVETNPRDGAAMTLIGELYAQGLGVKTDATEAARWLKLATEQGDRQAIFAYALAKLNGTGIEKDRPGAQELFLKAAALNHPGALYNLGVMAIENNGVVSDFPKAARYFKQAADLGYPDAAYALGLLFRNGNGVEKNETRAAEWLSKAAKDDYVPAQVEYAIMTFNGVGVEKDETAAAKLFLKAAAQNNPIAQDRVARLLASGRGIEKNMIEAMKWHLLARTAGLEDAWLDTQLKQLSAKDRAAVDSAVRQYIGR